MAAILNGTGTSGALRSIVRQSEKPMNDQRAERVSASVPAPSDGGSPGVRAAGAASAPSAAAESVLAGISDGIVSVDNDWRLVYVNPAAARMWGHGIEN